MDDLLEQDLFDVQDAKDVSLLPRYMIRNTKQPEVYWSAIGGWTNFSEADTYQSVDLDTTTLPVDGEWLGLEETALARVESSHSLKNLLGVNFVNKLQLDIPDYLIQYEWHNGGGRCRDRWYCGPLMKVRAALNTEESIQTYRTEDRARKLRESVATLIPRESRQLVHCWARQPYFDRWNDMWIFEVCLAPGAPRFQELSEDLNGHTQEIQFKKPEHLSEIGESAYHALYKFFQAEALRHINSEQTFVSPKEWHEDFGRDAELIVVHESGDHAPYFNPDYQDYMAQTRMRAMLDRIGFRCEQQTPWYSAIYPLSRLPQLSEAMDPDEDDLKDIILNPTVQKAVEALSGNLEMIGEPQALVLGGRQGFKILAQSKHAPGWDVSGHNIARWAGGEVVKKYDRTGTGRTHWNMRFDLHSGRWTYEFWFPLVDVTEAEEELDPKETWEPQNKLDRIQLLFSTMGFQITNSDEIPADPKWGDLGTPKHYIETVILPDTTKGEWVVNPMATTELGEFLTRAKSNLGEILGTADVDYTSRFSTERNAWIISWYVGDPKPMAESDDELDFKDVIEPARLEEVEAWLKANGFTTLNSVEGPDQFTKSTPDRKRFAQVSLRRKSEAVITISSEGLGGRWSDDIRAEHISLDQVIPLLSRDFAESKESEDLIHRLLEDSAEGDDNRVALVGVFRKKEDNYECLVAKREVDPAKGEWCIPGGHVQIGEKNEDGARREMQEETHLDLGELTFVKKMPNETGESEVFVYGAMLPDDGKPRAGDDAEKLKWVPLDDLPELAFDNQDLIREIADKMELAVDEIAESLEDKFKNYYKEFGAEMVDKAEESGYHFSLWHYPEADLYEVNIGQVGVDWTDPTTHTSQRKAGIIPRNLLQKIAEWMNIRGHLVMGSHNLERVSVYKRLLVRKLGAKIVDVDWAVPGGGQYFFAITTDDDVINRTRPQDEPPALNLEDSAEGDQSAAATVEFLLDDEGDDSEDWKEVTSPIPAGFVMTFHRHDESPAHTWSVWKFSVATRKYSRWAGEPLEFKFRRDDNRYQLRLAVPNTVEPVAYLEAEKKFPDESEALQWAFQWASWNAGIEESVFERLITEDKAKNKYGKDGLLIVFEGIDGAGKTTQVKRLADWLNEKDYSYVTTKWNGSKLLSDALWKAKKKKLLNPMSFSLLHASDMHLRYDNVIVPALKKGKVLICDRYYYTSYVRDQIRDIPVELIDEVYKNFRKPDLIFYCKVPVETAVERLMADRGVGYYSSGQDVGYGTKGIEKTTLAYETDMAERYEKLLQGETNVFELDMDRPVKEIASDVKKEVLKKLGLEEALEDDFDTKDITPEHDWQIVEQPKKWAHLRREGEYGLHSRQTDMSIFVSRVANGYNFTLSAPGSVMKHHNVSFSHDDDQAAIKLAVEWAENDPRVKAKREHLRQIGS